MIEASLSGLPAAKCKHRWFLALAMSTFLLTGAASAHDNLNSTMGTWERGALNSYNAPNGQVHSSTWVRKYFATAGQCLSFSIQPPVPFNDMELVVIAPDPSIRYRNDDSFGTCALCPALRIDPAPLTGYYTVIASHYIGSPVTTDFILEIARQDGGSLSCQNPSVAF